MGRRQGKVASVAGGIFPNPAEGRFRSRLAQSNGAALESDRVVLSSMNSQNQNYRNNMVGRLVGLLVGCLEDSLVCCFLGCLLNSYFHVFIVVSSIFQMLCLVLVLVVYSEDSRSRANNVEDCMFL